MISHALNLLATPRTPEELARALGLSLEATLLLLQQLEHKGYVVPLTCSTSCRLCAFRNLCPGPGKVYWVRRTQPRNQGETP
ncbi:MAG: hypothetical protein ACK4G4_08230 [Thermus sp.]|uniref:hypothetical protein n=1 Tax=Thermus sp. TaxID=275 RepID=UPI00391B5F79